MQNQDHAAPGSGFIQRFHEGAFRRGIQPGSRFIQNQHGRGRKQRARQCNAPRLTTRKPRPCLTALRLKPFRQSAHHIANARAVQGAPKCGVIRIRRGQAQIGGDAVIKQPCILRELGNTIAQNRSGQRRYLNTAQSDAALLGCGEFQQ